MDIDEVTLVRILCLQNCLDTVRTRGSDVGAVSESARALRERSPALEAGLKPLVLT